MSIDYDNPRNHHIDCLFAMKLGACDHHCEAQGRQATFPQPTREEVTAKGVKQKIIYVPPFTFDGATFHDANGRKATPFAIEHALNTTYAKR